MGVFECFNHMLPSCLLIKQKPCVGPLLSSSRCVEFWQDWFDFSEEAEARRLRPGPSPFKGGERSPFLDLPSAGPRTILVDSTHSFHIHGVGVDFAASLIVMCCRKGMWGQGSFDSRLELAYDEYMGWCSSQGKTTACSLWSWRKFDMSSTNDYPTSINGKGFDTVLVLQWLVAFMSDKVGYGQTLCVTVN